MALFARKPKPARHRVTIHFAQPVSPTTRHAQEDGIVGTLLPQLDATAQIIGGGTGLSPDGEPTSCDIELEITTVDIDRVMVSLVGVLDDNGIARGSWVALDGVRHLVGSSEFVLLRTRIDNVPSADAAALTTALQEALGSGSIGWHDETFSGANGPVYVFSGPSAENIMTALRLALPAHPLLDGAELASVTEGAAKAE
ncbi:hypothetical protein ACIGCK_14540 [Microbacterium sp. NPDC078428]|uniref:hypothetical protein n=1 Tax=Microbacterium sp. NPDC078428 TaxID=3364190 RepID=UPI0037C6F081